MKSLVGASSQAELIRDIFVGVNDQSQRVVKVLGGNVNDEAELLYQFVHIPRLTGPSTQATASSYYSDNSAYAPWRAFDGTDNFTWRSKYYQNDSQRWLQYDFMYYIIPTAVYIKNTCTNNNAWSFVFEARDDSSGQFPIPWDVLVDCSSNTGQVDTTYKIHTLKQYRYFRYRCTNGSGTYAAGMMEMDIYGIKI